MVVSYNHSTHYFRIVSMRSMRMLIIRNLSVIVRKNTQLYVKIRIRTHFQFSEIYFFSEKKRRVSESYNQLLEINPERSNAHYTGPHYTAIIRFFFQCVLYAHAWYLCFNSVICISPSLPPSKHVRIVRIEKKPV